MDKASLGKSIVLNPIVKSEGFCRKIDACAVSRFLGRLEKILPLITAFFPSGACSLLLARWVDSVSVLDPCSFEMSVPGCLNVISGNGISPGSQKKSICEKKKVFSLSPRCLSVFLPWHIDRWD